MEYVLFDLKQNKFFAQIEDSKKGFYLTCEYEFAYRFSEEEIELAWHMAYKCAWLGLGKFYVLGDFE